jgi:MFS family permease
MAVIGEWFAVSQRDVATTIAAMFNPIGIAVGQVIPTIIVSADGGMPTLLLVEIALAGVTTVLAFFFFRSQPPTPPRYHHSLHALM